MTWLCRCQLDNGDSHDENHKGCLASQTGKSEHESVLGFGA
jgi:hypothetical protein